MSKEKVENQNAVISKEKYGELLRCIDLHDIYLTDAKMSANRDALLAGANVALSFKEEIKLAHTSQDSARVFVDYSFRGKSGNRIVISIFVRFTVVFQLKSDSPFPVEFFDVYNKSSLPFQTFPYFREFVQSTVARMGLPPLVLPLRKSIPVK
ncbi:MAG: hypothetical protein GYA46_00540 [candidate division Zixibacteria bacterium]|nr:hypothetical protein [candidate division Zixibacteria bacterium]